jgi:hypothetical protein
LRATSLITWQFFVSDIWPRIYADERGLEKRFRSRHSERFLRFA